MGTILLKAVTLDGKKADILIKGNRIEKIIPWGENGTPVERCGADRVLNCSGKTAIPGMINMHCHAAMTMMRGLYEEDPLHEWLKKIWAIEAKLDNETVYWGTKLAILEMIRTGTTCFLDMYWKAHQACIAAEEMGIRAFLTYNFLDNFNEETAEQQKAGCRKLYEASKNWNSRVKMGISVHADYTTSETVLKWSYDFAKEHGMVFTGHIGETLHETQDDITKYGMTPVEHFNQLGILGNMVVAHGVWLNDHDIELLAKNNATVVHNINSNLKLASGYKFKYNELRDAGVNVCVGTDGASSSNNLDLRESMKTAAFLQKAWREDPKALPLDELMAMATVNGAKALGIKAGRIEEGALADIVLVNSRDEAFIPSFNFTSSFIFTANSSCIDTVLCDGKIIMENRKVPGEDEILEKADELAWKLIKIW